jgi:hypothetical protein
MPQEATQTPRFDAVGTEGVAKKSKSLKGHKSLSLIAMRLHYCFRWNTACFPGGWQLANTESVKELNMALRLKPTRSVHGLESRVDDHKRHITL